MNANCVGTLYFTFVQVFGAIELKKDDKFMAATIPAIIKQIKNMEPTPIFKVVCAASMQELIAQNQKLKETLVRRMRTSI